MYVAYSLTHIRTHNTDLKNRLTAYAVAHPDQGRQTDADPDTGCMEWKCQEMCSRETPKI